MKNKQITLFIVDDDSVLSTLLKNEIKRSFPSENIVIYTFAAGELCESLVDHKPDIAIVDYHLNARYKDAMNGIEVMDLLKKQCPDTNLILFTREEDVSLAIKAFDHGAHDYVIKNEFMFKRLNVAIVQCLRLRKIKQEFELQKKRGKMAVFLMTLLLACAMILQFIIPGLLLSRSS
jgi:DNA-binding NarL/FixJ family response regulator